MAPDIYPRTKLSQVAFVHDYLQLVFGESRFSLYNMATLQAHALSIRQGQIGFADALVALIGQKLSEVRSSDESLHLMFESGTSIVVPLGGGDMTGPEAWEFQSDDKLIVAEQNA